MAGTDGNAGYFSPVNPGVVRTFELIFNDAVQSFDAVASIISTSMTVSPKSKAADPNAAALAVGASALIGNSVVQVLGLPDPAAGFQPGVLYIFSAKVLTNSGQTLFGYGHIPCTAIV